MAVGRNSCRIRLRNRNLRDRRLHTGTGEISSGIVMSKQPASNGEVPAIAGEMRPAFNSVWRAPARQACACKSWADDLGRDVSDDTFGVPGDAVVQNQIPGEYPAAIIAGSAAGSTTGTARITAMCRYDILGTPRDGAFEAARLFRVLVASVTSVDTDRIWLKAAHGLDGARQLRRDPGLCDLAQDEAYVATVTFADPWTAGNPLVGREPGALRRGGRATRRATLLPRPCRMCRGWTGMRLPSGGIRPDRAGPRLRSGARRPRYRRASTCIPAPRRRRRRCGARRRRIPGVPSPTRPSPPLRFARHRRHACALYRRPDGPIGGPRRRTPDRVPARPPGARWWRR
jgi:hypothetical protein